jgi:4-hydroxy-tetrahydrodipicolinate reductase
MGQAVLQAAAANTKCSIKAALVRSGSNLVGQDTGIPTDEKNPRLVYTETLGASITPQVMIDFSTAQAFDNCLALAVNRKIAFISGTTGLSTEQKNNLRHAATQIPVLWASNFSLGVALLNQLVHLAASKLDDRFEIEIIETHHRNKIDAPSGTALSLGQTAAKARGNDFDHVAQFARHGLGEPRSSRDIGFAVVRAADVIGEHTVLFAAPGERIEITHKASNRNIFAQGAVQAAIWLSQQKPGTYDIADVLG